MTETRYAFDNAWVEARRRLGHLETICDPWTRRNMLGLGVGPGWRCLEVGAGGGSVTRWLCERVGPDGRVTAVDLDTRFVENEDFTNLEVLQRDIVAQGLPGGGYDLVHARALLMHLPDRDQLVEQFIAAVRPGGVILLEEGDTHPLGMNPSPVVRTALQYFVDAAAGAGMDPTWARNLPAILQRHGLVDITAAGDELWGAGGSAVAELLLLSCEQVRPLVDDEGRAAFDAAAALLAEVSSTTELSGAAILRHAVGLEGSAFGGPVTVDGSGWAADLLRSAADARSLPAPDGFVGELRPYQADARG
ncbi:MAG: class I SAM-dependent methyltransferase, partial [Candidatus Methylomirabilales bacterium]